MRTLNMFIDVFLLAKHLITTPDFSFDLCAEEAELL
jgi:hypothetical protein